MKSLGKLPKREDKRTFKLIRYMPTLPPIPTVAGWDQGRKAWGMMGNDDVGDCTVACGGHFEMIWTMNASNLYQPTDTQILADYSKITGYTPSNPASDTGANELDVLNYWRTNGIAGHKIDGYVEIDLVNSTQVVVQKNVMTGVHLFGGVYTGVGLPNDWEKQLDANQPWTVTPGNPFNQDNGHATPIVAYDQTYVYYITWGQIQAATWAWFFEATDEVYAPISLNDWFLNGQAPNCFDISTLQADLKLL